MIPLVLSLGTNIPPRINYLKQAVKLLKNHFKLLSVSSYYETSPVEDFDQEKFYNMAVIFLTDIDDPFDILRTTQSVEKQIGRIKDESRPKGPRIIDIDIIFFGNLNIKTEKLIIPHDKFFYRKFVIVPILEILEHDSSYLQKYDFNGYLNKITGQNIKRIGDFKIE